MRNPSLDYLMSVLTAPPAKARPVMAPADATARPNSRESGIGDALTGVLSAINRADTKVGRDLAARMPAGATLYQGMVPGFIGGPKGVADDALSAARRVLVEARARASAAEKANHAMRMSWREIRGTNPGAVERMRLSSRSDLEGAKAAEDAAQSAYNDLFGQWLRKK